jgi:hypothetical protein
MSRGETEAAGCMRGEKGTIRQERGRTRTRMGKTKSRTVKLVAHADRVQRRRWHLVPASQSQIGR